MVGRLLLILIKKKVLKTRIRFDSPNFPRVFISVVVTGSIPGGYHFRFSDASEKRLIKIFL